MIWFILGFVMGVPLGVFVTALCQMASDDDQIERKPYDKHNPYDYY